MRAMKKIPVFLLTMILCIGSMAMPAFAASSYQDGLEVTLTTNKELYSQSEHIVSTLTVTNTNDFAVSNVSLENMIPEGYTLAEGTEVTKQIESLDAGETVSLTVTYVPESSGNGSNASADGNNTTGGNGRSGNDSNNSGTHVSTGDNSNIILWVSLLVLAICGIVVLIVLRKKSGKKLLSLFLCVAMVGTVWIGVSVSAEAAELQNKSISISESVEVNNASLDVCAVVKYNATQEIGDEVEKPTIPETPSEVDEYYWENSKEVIAVIDAKESEDVPSEKEVLEIFESRGFEDCDIFYSYNIDGKYCGNTEVEENSENKHPVYQAYYVSENRDVWTLYATNGKIMAYPASFNLESELDAEVIFTETAEISSYDPESNQFYVTIPKDTAAIIKVVDRIDSETLDKFTIEEISNDE